MKRNIPGIGWASRLKAVFVMVLAVGSLAIVGPSWAATKTVRAVMHAPLRILDPVTTTAYITRDYGYMVYDTLVAMDENFEVRPQMADWKVSPDNLVYTFTLRDGLLWHDGTPVTAEDCIASLERWRQRDSMGQKLFSYISSITATTPKVITITMKEPVGFVLQALGKPSSLVPFMMPKRIASTPATTAITESIGSGPFKFVKEEFQPGVKAVFVKNEKYVPRSEKSSWAAGGKAVKVDRVEWVVVPDAQTAINALTSGEIDYIDEPQIDLLKLLEGEKSVVIGNPNPYGLQVVGRMNFLNPPFDNVKVRRAAMLALKQENFLAAIAGDSKFYKVCGAMFVCGTPLATDVGSETLVKGGGMAEAKKVLKESGYDGTPIRIIHPTDVNTQKTQPVIAMQLLKEAGFKVELITLDWQAALGMRNNQKPASEGGWNMFFSAWGGADVSNPLTSPTLNATGKNGSAWAGWPEDADIEALRDKFGRAKTPEERKAIAVDLQRLAYERVIYVPLGQLATPAAWSAKLKNVPAGPASPYFWGVEKAD
ncbi:peptide/nickel transport system substrate-binding protein [Variovorax sp. HW608]|nr:peptide/nickel transport system substrate-binding protein [Variovorax sp. HW608]